MTFSPPRNRQSPALFANDRHARARGCRAIGIETIPPAFAFASWPTAEDPAENATQQPTAAFVAANRLFEGLIEQLSAILSRAFTAALANDFHKPSPFFNPDLTSEIKPFVDVLGEPHGLFGLLHGFFGGIEPLSGVLSRLLAGAPSLSPLQPRRSLAQRQPPSASPLQGCATENRSAHVAEVVSAKRCPTGRVSASTAPERSLAKLFSIIPTDMSPIFGIECALAHPERQRTEIPLISA